LPRVSGIKKNVNASARRQNTAKKIYVPQEIESSMSGVTSPIMLQTEVSETWPDIFFQKSVKTHKLHIHVAEVVMEMAFDRIERLKISEGRTHPMGAIR
jgi:hypothetical protein